VGPVGPAAAGALDRSLGAPGARVVLGAAAAVNTRSNQALELVRNQPGITIPQIAEALKIEPNYLYRVMPKLVSDGQVRRDGQGWHPAGGQAKS